MKIVLLGYMASGKSIIGKELSKLIDLPFIDLDFFIEDKENMSISDIFAQKGEIYFRTIENKYLKELLNTKENFVLSLGGGTPCYANNMDMLLNIENLQSFYLKSSIATIINRLEGELTKRPLIAHLSSSNLQEFIAKHLFERTFYYEKAHHSIIVDKKNIETIVSEIKTTLDR